MSAQINAGVVASREDAQTQADMIRAELDSLAKNLGNVAELVVQAWREQDHIALGCASWDDYGMSSSALTCSSWMGGPPAVGRHAQGCWP